MLHQNTKVCSMVAFLMYVSNPISMTSNVSLHVLKMTISAEREREKKKKEKKRKTIYIMLYKYNKLAI
jgi:hypothetical protein